MKQVLIIDDTRSMRRYLKKKLEQRGWSVVEAYDIDSGWLAFQRLTPPLVILDLVMPMTAMDTVDLIQSIKDKTTLIVVTSIIPPPYMRKFFDYNHIDIYNKPTPDHPHINELLVRIDEIGDSCD